MGMKGIEDLQRRHTATDLVCNGLLISNLRSNDLRGRFEATMASEAVGGNMHMDTRVIKVADVKSEVI